MPDEIRIAVIGYGNAGRIFHRPLIAATAGLRVEGVCVRDPGRRAQAASDLGCRTWDSYPAVLADPAVDAVVIATPTALHVEQALDALAAGKHVVVDKPVCLDLPDLDLLGAAAKAAGRVLVPFHNRRWDGDFLTVQRLLEAGSLGRLRVVEMAWGSSGSARGWRATVAAGGGRIYDLGTHMADQICQLLPAEPLTVYCRGQHDIPGQEVESHAVTTIGFADGATAVFEVSYMSRKAKPRFRLIGTDATFEKHGLDPQEAALRAGDLGLARESEDEFGILASDAGQTRIPTVPGRWLSFYEGVRDHLLGSAPNPVPLRSLRRPMAIIEAAARSAASGEIVRLR